MSTTAERLEVLPAAIPWLDRGEGEPGAPHLSPRSTKDVEILRALGRRINPNDAGANNNLGVVFYNKSLYADAVHHFELALELDPRMHVAERNLQIAYFATGYFDGVIGELRKRLDADPVDAPARDKLARTYFYGGDAAAAIREWRQVLHQRPRDAALYQNIARAELKRGDLDAALSALRNAAAINPRSARIQLRMGEVLYQRGLHADAREALERAVAQDEGIAEAHHLLTFVYGDLGDAEAAARAAARAAELNPSYTKVEANLSLDRYSTARYEELVGDRTRPGVAEGGTLAHYNLGLAFRQKALYDEAMREFRLATERGEDSYLVVQAQAEMLLLRGGGEGAVGLYRGLIEEEPASPKLWNELGVAQHQAGALDEAEQAYRRALELDPAYALAWNNLGVVAHHRGGPDAEPAFRAALREGRALGDVWRNLALMLHRNGRGDEAGDAYRAGLQRDGRSAPAWAGLGILLLEQGRAAEARDALVRAVDLDPNLAEARYHLAFALSAAGDYQGALRETRLALELNPYIPAPRFRLLIDLQFEEAGVLAPELDAPEQVPIGEAIDSFEFQPDALDALFPADAPVAAELLEEPLSARPSAAPSIEYMAAARVALDSGEYGAATAHVQRAVALDANRVETQLLQGEIFLASGVTGEAVERFNDVLRALARADAANAAAFDHADALRRALLGAARSLLDLGRPGQAIDIAERLYRQAPSDRDAIVTFAAALRAMGANDRAAAVLEDGSFEWSDDVEILTRLGSAYTATGNRERAEIVLRRALELDAHAPAARAALGRLLAADERHADAAAEFRAALDSIPSYGDAAFGLAELEAERGRLREAINVLVDLLTVDPYHLAGLVRLGDLLCRANMQAQAGFAYRRVLRFDPGHAAALEALERLVPAGGNGAAAASTERSG